jgi:hypothetical protein
MENNNIMERVNEMKETNNLYEAVIEDVLDDVNSNENDVDFQEELETRLSDILEHGCVSGTVGSLVYYADTTKFYEEHKEDINGLLYEMMEETGLYSPAELFGDKFDKEDPLCVEQTNQNLLAWFAYEEVSRKLMYEINPNF